MRVLVCDNLDPVGAKVLEEAGIDVDVRNDLDPAGLLEVIGAYDGLVVRSKTKVTSAVLAAAERLKVVGRAGTGVDNIDVPEATRRGVVVMNAAAGNTVTTAEHALALMMSLARRIPQATASTKAGAWEKTKFTGVELSNKTLGIVGVGKIGSVVADRAAGLRMRVLAFDPYLTREAAAKMGVELVALDELLARADFISVHTPLTDETRGILGRDAFAKMKPGVRIVNFARGGLVDESALHDAIVDGRVAGAALDVFATEPVAADHPLLGREEVIVTPHLGASTEEAQSGVAVIIAEQMADYLTKGSVRGAVNAPSLNAEQLARLGPYIELGERLGRFAGQAFGRELAEVSIDFSGDVADYDVRPVAQAVLVGLLAPIIDRINVVNAAVVAEERGIRVRQATDRQARDYASMITVRTRTEEGEHEVAGAMFDRGDARIVRVDGFDLEAVPEGHLVLLANRDVPGVIGHIATFLGDQGINIARFYLGRKLAGDVAMALVQVDEPLSEAQRAALAGLPEVLSARRITLSDANS
jgi:D-3-phosphoglycerate dehydrogenase